MKKLLIIFALLQVIVNINAQTIPNAGFENWTDFGLYENPDGWFTTNDSIVNNVNKVSPGAVGNYCIKLTTKLPYSGVMFSGNSLSNYGFAFNARPTSLLGFFKYNIYPEDTATILVSLSKWNATTLQSDLIGFNRTDIPSGVQNSWINFDLPITYYSSNFPDTAKIIIGTNQAAISIDSSYLYIDELSFSGITSNIKKNILDGFSIFPNPTNSTITFNIPVLKNSNVSITTLTGTEVGNYNTQNTSTQTIDISHLASGVYFVSLKSEEGVLTKKIIKQ